MLYSTTFRSDNATLNDAFERATAALAANLRPLPLPDGVRGPDTVLIEGGGYPGLWHECGPSGRRYFRTLFRSATASR